MLNFSATLLIVTVIVVAALAYWFGKYRAKTSIDTIVTSNDLVEAIGMECISIYDQSGSVVLQGSEILKIPTYARKLDPANSIVRQAAQLTSEVFKGAISLPNRSINLVFKPEVQTGLKDGTYTLMKTKSGEMLADAIDSSGKIVAKGRVVETGKLRQLASGGFQLASIVVAQAHLADIERSLSALRKDVTLILDDLEATNIANITGKSSYLSDLVEHIKRRSVSGELPPHFANSIQQIVLESHSLRDKLYKDMEQLISRIEKQDDPDSWGTEGVYKALAGHVEKAEILILRHHKLLNLMATINYVATFIDPTGKEFFPTDINAGCWNELSKRLATLLSTQANNFLSSARFNSDETLALRKKDIIRDSEVLLKKSTEQQLSFDTTMRAIVCDNNRYFNKQAEMHVALTFDNDGRVKEAAIL